MRLFAYRYQASDNDFLRKNDKIPVPVYPG